MFSIIISEKGGAERKETFDKNEINVGRVQGNDLMLPKGNVSKHHARLLFRDGRFIVTDLKSTNGTYVNGRKIAQATIVREGDKIYIGDFVLRLDGGLAPPQPEPPAPVPPADEDAMRTLARNQQQNAAAAPAPAPQPMSPATMKAQQQPAAMGPQPMGPRPMQPMPQPSAPPTQESEDAEAANGLGGGPPRPMPVSPVAAPALSPRGGTLQLPQSPAAALAPPQRGPALAPPGATPVPMAVQPVPAPAPVLSPVPGPVLSPVPAPVAPPANNVNLMATRPAASSPVPLPGAAPVQRAVPRETAAQAGRRLALITLVDRIADAVDLRQLKSSPIVEDGLAQQIDRAAREQAGQMRDEGEAPEGTDIEALVRDAVRELVGLGPVGPLLEDEDVSEIHCVRSDQVLAVRGGQVTLAEPPFTSEEALYRVIARLANQSGDPWKSGETVLERRLPRGAQMVAIAPPASASYVLVIRKKRRVDASLEDLVRGGSLSRPMATFLEACLTARANLLLSGPVQGATSQLLAALASAVPAGERISLLHEVDEINVPHAHMVSLPLPESRQAEETVRAAARLRSDRMVIGSLAGGAALGALTAIAEGTEGILAATSAPTLRQGLSRLVAQIVLQKPGTTWEGVREAVGEAFDVAIEVGSLPDGRPRVLRISELAGSDGKAVSTRDIFTVDSAGEFVATGTVPRLAGDLAARGIKLDPATFKRGK